MGSKQFHYISIDYYSFGSLNDAQINTKELEMHEFPLEEILISESVKSNSLTADYHNEQFEESLLTMDIGLV